MRVSSASRRSVGSSAVPSARTAPCATSVKSVSPLLGEHHLQVRGGARQQLEDRAERLPLLVGVALGGLRAAASRSAARSGSLCCGERHGIGASCASSCFWVSAALGELGGGFGMQRAGMCEQAARARPASAASSSARVGAAPVLRSHWSRLASIVAIRSVAVSTLLSRCRSSRARRGRELLDARVAPLRRSARTRPRRCRAGRRSATSTGIWRVSEAQKASMVWMRRRWRDLAGVRQLREHALAHLGRRLDGEGDGDDLFGLLHRAEQADVALHQQLGLARARRRLDDEGAARRRALRRGRG